MNAVRLLLSQQEKKIFPLSALCTPLFSFCGSGGTSLAPSDFLGGPLKVPLGLEGSTAMGSVDLLLASMAGALPVPPLCVSLPAALRGRHLFHRARRKPYSPSCLNLKQYDWYFCYIVFVKTLPYF